MTTYVSARLDGTFMCGTLQAGVLRNTSSPVVCFTVEAGIQTHPIWALDRLAIVAYAYCLASKDNPVDVSLEGTLMSNDSISVVLAQRIQWHTSRKVRITADQLVSEMYQNGKLPLHWPVVNLSLPVSFRE